MRFRFSVCHGQALNDCIQHVMVDDVEFMLANRNAVLHRPLSPNRLSPPKIIRPNVFRPSGSSPNSLHPVILMSLLAMGKKRECGSDNG